MNSHVGLPSMVSQYPKELHAQNLRVQMRMFLMQDPAAKNFRQSTSPQTPCPLRKKPITIFEILILAILISGNGSWAGSEDLRHPRGSFPDLSHVFEIGIALTLPSSQTQNYDRLYRTIGERMEQLGYTVTSPTFSKKAPLTLVVKCEEGGFPGSITKDSETEKDSNHSLERPPCHVSYSYEGHALPWKNIDRIIYDEGLHITRQLLKQSQFAPGEIFFRFLHAYDFPILMAAEWEHVPRLLKKLEDPASPWGRKRLIVRLLGELQDPRVYSPLLLALQYQPLIIDVAKSLGFYGLKARPHLQHLLQEHPNPLVKAAAAQGLGRIAAQTGDSGLTPLFLKIIQDPHEDIRVKTEVVWALGKAPDMSAFYILQELEHIIWTRPHNDPEMNHLRRAVDWSIREIKQGGHGDNF